MLCCVTIVLSGLSKVALQVTHKGSTIAMLTFWSVMENNYCRFYSVKSLSCLFLHCKFWQVLKAEKKCVVRITAIDLRKGSKNTSLIKTSRSPAFKKFVQYKPFSSAIRTPGDVFQIDYFFSPLNGWHHPLEIFHQPFEWLFVSDVFTWEVTIVLISIHVVQFALC